MNPEHAEMVERELRAFLDKAANVPPHRCSMTASMAAGMTPTRRRPKYAARLDLLESTVVRIEPSTDFVLHHAKVTAFCESVPGGVEGTISCCTLLPIEERHFLQAEGNGWRVPRDYLATWVDIAVRKHGFTLNLG